MNTAKDKLSKALQCIADHLDHDQLHDDPRLGEEGQPDECPQDDTCECPTNANISEAFQAAEAALQEARAAALEEAARVADGWAAQYPEDVFPGDGATIECRAAAFARHVATHIAGDVRALKERKS